MIKRQWGKWRELLALLAAGSPLTALAIEAPALAGNALWHSAYISEGRDNLGDGGIVALSGSADWELGSLGAWYAVGDSESYDELNLSAVLAFQVGPAEASLGYTRLEFFRDHASDNEFTAGITTVLPGGLNLALNVVHSTEADGEFVELTFAAPVESADGLFTLQPYLLQGWDAGYASAAHDGRNHFQCGLNASFHLQARVSIVGALAYSWAQEDVERDGLGDELWARVGVSVLF